MKVRIIFFIFIFFSTYNSCDDFKNVVPVDVGSEIVQGISSEVMEVQRIAPIVFSMRAINLSKIAMSVVLHPKFEEVFDNLSESEFKDEIRRQYYLKNGVSIDKISINFSVLELLNSGLLDSKIENASKTGVLDLSNIKISSLYGIANVLDKIKKPVWKLDLSNNKLDVIFAEDFGVYLSRLKKLDLSYNKIYKIEPESFDQLGNLSFLDLGNNRLSSLPLGIFSLLARIESIDLSDNLFRKIDIKQFLSLKKLKNLNLADNQIKGIDKNLLDKVTAEVYLKGNPSF